MAGQIVRVLSNGSVECALEDGRHAGVVGSEEYFLSMDALSRVMARARKNMAGKKGRGASGSTVSGAGKNSSSLTTLNGHKSFDEAKRSSTVPLPTVMTPSSGIPIGSCVFIGTTNPRNRGVITNYDASRGLYNVKYDSSGKVVIGVPEASVIRGDDSETGRMIGGTSPAHVSGVASHAHYGSNGSVGPTSGDTVDTRTNRVHIESSKGVGRAVAGSAHDDMTNSVVVGPGHDKAIHSAGVSTGRDVGGRGGSRYSSGTSQAHVVGLGHDSAIHSTGMSTGRDVGGRGGSRRSSGTPQSFHDSSVDIGRPTSWSEAISTAGSAQSHRGMASRGSSPSRSTRRGSVYEAKQAVHRLVVANKKSGDEIARLKSLLSEGSKSDEHLQQQLHAERARSGALEEKISELEAGVRSIRLSRQSRSMGSRHGGGFGAQGSATLDDGGGANQIAMPLPGSIGGVRTKAIPLSASQLWGIFAVQIAALGCPLSALRCRKERAIAAKIAAVGSVLGLARSAPASYKRIRRQSMMATSAPPKMLFNLPTIQATVSWDALI